MTVSVAGVGRLSVERPMSSIQQQRQQQLLLLLLQLLVLLPDSGKAHVLRTNAAVCNHKQCENDDNHNDEDSDDDACSTTRFVLAQPVYCKASVCGILSTKPGSVIAYVPVVRPCVRKSREGCP